MKLIGIPELDLNQKEKMRVIYRLYGKGRVEGMV